MVNYKVCAAQVHITERTMTIKKYVGDKAFYRRVLGVAVPMMIQNGVTNLVNLLDNVMVGSLSTEAMSGVSIVNQFIFIFNLLIFGAVSAAGIFTAQFHGLEDVQGEKYTFRFKFLINLFAGLMGVIAFAVFSKQLIQLFLHIGGNSEGDLELTLSYGQQYLFIMLIGLVPYAISQAYASTMRETGQTVVPMVASLCAVLTNFILNAILIFGLLGAPALGVKGAAIATVASRFVELSILTVWGHTHREKCPYLVGAFRSLAIPRELFRRIIVNGLPLMANEFFWAIAMTMRNQSYSTRGLDVVAAQNIAMTIINLFNVIYMAVGSSIAIIVGKELGAGEIEKGKDSARKLMAFSISCAFLMELILFGISSFFPLLYNTSDGIRELSTYMIRIMALALPFFAYANSAYFTLRSGGKVAITLLFDSVYMWSITIPVVFCLSRFTDMGIHWLFVAGTLAEVFKCVFGFILLKKVNWAKQLVKKQ